MKKLWIRLMITHFILLLYILATAITSYQGYVMKIDMFGTPIDLWIVLMIMYVLELLSTFTFQLRIKLTSDYEISKDNKLIEIVPIIAGVSWMVSGFQGIIFLTALLDEGSANDINDLGLAFLKLVPVFIATYNGVYSTMTLKRNTKKKE